jgi:hypothetical protein
MDRYAAGREPENGVTLSGSPPKAAMFSRTHLSAAIVHERNCPWFVRMLLAQGREGEMSQPPETVVDGDQMTPACKLIS